MLSGFLPRPCPLLSGSSFPIAFDLLPSPPGVRSFAEAIPPLGLVLGASSSPPARDTSRAQDSSPAVPVPWEGSGGARRGDGRMGAPNARAAGGHWGSSWSPPCPGHGQGQRGTLASPSLLLKLFLPFPPVFLCKQLAFEIQMLL